jgi:hypothetical protein
MFEAAFIEEISRCENNVRAGICEMFSKEGVSVLDFE